MNYLEFLRGWYNLVFLLAGAGGLACFAWGRFADRDLFRPSVVLVVAAVTGLTWNGAIHDLGLGSAAPRFPLVVLVSAAVGLITAIGVGRIRDRHFRPVSAVQFNRPGHEGIEARVVTKATGADPGTGRAQWQDTDGVLHIVHIHTAAAEISFGRMVRLGPFDPVVESYLAEPLPRGRKRHPPKKPSDE